MKRTLLVKFLNYFCLSVSTVLISGCGQASQSFVEPRVIPASLSQPPGLTAIAFDTAVNVLRNSLLEAILLLIAVVLFLRYKAISDKNRNMQEKKSSKVFNDFVDYKSSFDYSNWHFNEDERKN